MSNYMSKENTNGRELVMNSMRSQINGQFVVARLCRLYERSES